MINTTFISEKIRTLLLELPQERRAGVLFDTDICLSCGRDLCGDEGERITCSCEAG